MRHLLAPALVAALLTTSAGALAGPRASANTVGTSAAMRLGKSVGSPTTGRLIGGSRLEETNYLRVVPVHADEDVRWGLGPLVSMIDRAARQVRRQFPESVLTVGHLSRAGGGEIDQHASHESGRDADVLFFAKNKQGKGVLPERFVAYRGDGTAPTWPGASFDDARNWLLVTAFLTDPVARVSHIFVASPLRARLLAYAEKIKAPESLRARAAELMVQPRGVLPHDDHFHVRIACPEGMKECVENPLPKRRAPVAKAQPAPQRHRGGPTSATAPAGSPLGVPVGPRPAVEPASSRVAGDAQGTNTPPPAPAAGDKGLDILPKAVGPTRLDGTPPEGIPDPSTPSLPAVLGAPNAPVEDSDGE